MTRITILQFPDDTFTLMVTYIDLLSTIDFKMTCRTARRTRLEDAVLFATSPDQFTPEEYRFFDGLSQACAGRRFGGDCYSYGLLASGHIDLILEAGLQPYDYLPLVPIVTGAGGMITDWDGAPLTLRSQGRVLAAATPDLHRKAVERLRNSAA